MNRKLLTLPVVFLLAVTLSAVAASAGPACCQPKNTADASVQSPLSDADLEAVVTFVNNWCPSGLKIMNAGGYIKLENPRGEVHNVASLAEATGIALTDADMEHVLDTLIARAGSKAQVRGGSCAAPSAASTCPELTLASDHDGCLLGGTVASVEHGGSLYAKAMASDRTKFADRRLPEFNMQDLEGQPVARAELNGQPAIVALLSDQCGHSLRTFSTLQRLQKRHPDLQITAIFVEPQSVDDLRAKLESRAVGTKVRVSNDAAYATGIAVVPTLLFVDATGRIHEQVVGEKMEKTLAQRLGAWIQEDSTRVGLNQD